MAKMKTVSSRNGETFEVNTETCDQFGCEAGDRIRIYSIDQEAVVVGVGPVPCGGCTACVPEGQTEVLWVQVDGRDHANFFPNPEGQFQKVG